MTFTQGPWLLIETKNRRLKVIRPTTGVTSFSYSPTDDLSTNKNFKTLAFIPFDNLEFLERLSNAKLMTMAPTLFEILADLIIEIENNIDTDGKMQCDKTLLIRAKLVLNQVRNVKVKE